MSLSFKRGMHAFLNMILFFKGENFKILREFDMCGVHVKEYRYNLSKFLTDVWPPNILGGTGLPIKSAIREDDGSDVTEMVLRFSGPKKNYVNPVSVFRKKKKLKIDYGKFGVLRLVFEDEWEPYTGNIIVTDILGIKRVVRVH